MRCIYCHRRHPTCGFYPMAWISVPDGQGQLCWDCDHWLRAGRPERELPTDETSVGSFFMRCCGHWEEDENLVNWHTIDQGSYLHWGACLGFGQREARC